MELHTCLDLAKEATKHENRAWRGAYLKGVMAGFDGKGTCPYEDKRTSRGSVTFSRGFMKAWREGRNFGQECADE